MKIKIILSAIAAVGFGTICCPITELRAQDACSDPGVVCVPLNKPRNDQSGAQGPDQQAQQPGQPVQGQTSQNGGEVDQPSQGQTSQGATGSASQQTPANYVVAHKLGSSGMLQMMNRLNAMKDAAGTGQGAPNADTYFDNAPPPRGTDDALQPQGTPFFQSERKPTTVYSADKTVATYGSYPGGVVLEGAVVFSGADGSVSYDPNLNALNFGDRAAYLIPILPQNFAVLCRAIAQDDRIGVSLGSTQLVLGKLPKDSEVAWDLKLADHFLGDIAFGEKTWSAGYLFPNGYTPKQPQHFGALAVFFTFNDFKFDVNDEEIQAAGSNLSVQLVPLSANRAPDGGLLPDDAAIRSGLSYPEFEANVDNIVQNISYYGKEKIIERTYQYGEVAALLRGLKKTGVDLDDLAQHVESSFGTSSGQAEESGDPKQELEGRWTEYLKEIQAHSSYANWSAPPYDLYVSTQRDSFVSYINFDLQGNDLETIRDSTFDSCQSACRANAQCQAFTFDRWNNWCFLKDQTGTLLLQPRAVTAIRHYLAHPVLSEGDANHVERYTNIDSPGWDLPWVRNVETLGDCENICVQDSSCAGYTYNVGKATCIQKTYMGKLVSTSEEAVTGVIVWRDKWTSTAPRHLVRRYSNEDAWGNDRGEWIHDVDIDRCEEICLSDSGCVGYTFNIAKSTCILKSSVGKFVKAEDPAVTGIIADRGGL
jgi:hypothetical protein